MNFVHSKSQECTKSELDLFSVPPTQVSLEKGHWIDHQPVYSVSDGGPITFLSPGTEDYVDLSKTILVVRAKVTKADGANLDADEKVGVVNNFLHSLFKGHRDLLIPCLSRNPSQLWSSSKKISTHCGSILQRYCRENGHSRSYVGC